MSLSHVLKYDTPKNHTLVIFQTSVFVLLAGKRALEEGRDKNKARHLDVVARYITV